MLVWSSVILILESKFIFIIIFVLFVLCACLVFERAGEVGKGVSVFGWGELGFFLLNYVGKIQFV